MTDSAGVPIWEHGSDFQWPELELDCHRQSWLPADASFWHSGRHALRALLQHLAPRRVLFPSYYCQSVLEAASAFEVRCYSDGPEDPEIPLEHLQLRAGDAVVVTNPFGLRQKTPVRWALPNGVSLIEDHTHDPLSAWARSSAADWAFASLRKSLPLPDGAALWSPKGIPVPVPPPLHPDAAAITLQRLGAMLLKQRYLAGEPVSKTAFRALAIAGERAIGLGEPQPMSAMSRALLDAFPVGFWRSKRTINHAALEAGLSGVDEVRLLRHPPNTAPFVAVLVLESEAQRDQLSAALIARHVYPAVLWSIDSARATGIPDAHVALGARTLCLHCDHRYSETDMRRVAKVIRAVMP